MSIWGKLTELSNNYNALQANVEVIAKIIESCLPLTSQQPSLCDQTEYTKSPVTVSLQTSRKKNKTGNDQIPQDGVMFGDK